MQQFLDHRVQVAGGLAALYPAGSVPMSDAAAPALEAGEPGRDFEDAAAAAGEFRDASVEFDDGEGHEAAPRQPARTDADSIGEDEAPAPVRRPGSLKVICDIASHQRRVLICGTELQHQASCILWLFSDKFRQCIFMLSNCVLGLRCKCRWCVSLKLDHPKSVRRRGEPSSQADVHLASLMLYLRLRSWQLLRLRRLEWHML